LYLEPLESRTCLSGDFAHTTAELSQKAGRSAAVTVGTQALFAGGGVVLNPGLSKTTIDVYDASTGQWSAASLPANVHPDRVATAVRGRALFNDTGYVPKPSSHGSLIDLFNPLTGRWSATKSPTLRSDAAAATIGGKALFIGGAGGADSADIYDAGAKAWHTLRLPLPTRAPLAAVVGPMVFVTTDSHSALDVYNGRTGRWSVVAVPDGAIVSDGATPLGLGRSLLIASSTGFDSGVLSIYDAVNGTWSPMQLSHNLGTPTAVGAKGIFAGGGATNDLVDVYDSATGNLSSADALVVGRSSIAATTVGTHAIFAGGDLPSGPPDSSAAVDVFTDTSTSPVLSGSLTGKPGRNASVIAFNTGDADLAAGYTVKLYASADRTLNGATLLGSTTVQSPLAAGSSAQVSVPSKLPAGIAPGSYHLLAAVADSDGNLTPIAAEDATFHVRAGGKLTPATDQVGGHGGGMITRISRSAGGLT
jgi:hypothetical protein